MTYFNKPSDLAPVTKARSVDINNLAALIAAAFGKLPDELDLKMGTVNYAVNTGPNGAAYSVVMATAIKAYADGLEVKMRPVKDNTGACTLNVNGLGNIAIKRADGTDPQAGDILGNTPITLTYQTAGNVFRLPAVVNSQIIQAASSSAQAEASAAAAAGSAAIALKTLAIESNDPPANPIEGQEWIDAATGRRFTFIESQWAETYASQVVDQPTLVDALSSALQLSDYAAVRAYASNRQSVYVTGYLAAKAPSGIAGMFVRDDSDVTSADNGGTIIVAANGKRWKRVRQPGVSEAGWFGAKFDNVADDYAPIMAAAADLGANGGILRLPQGSGRHGQKITFTTPIILEGVGRAAFLNAYATRLSKTGNFVGIEFAQGAAFGGMRNMTYDRVGAVDTSDGVYVTAGRIDIENVTIQNHGRHNINVYNANCSQFRSLQLLAAGMDNFYVEGNAASPDINGMLIINLDSRLATRHGYNQVNGFSNTLIAPSFQGNKGFGLNISGDNNIAVGVYSENNTLGYLNFGAGADRNHFIFGIVSDVVVVSNPSGTNTWTIPGDSISSMNLGTLLLQTKLLLGNSGSGAPGQLVIQDTGAGYSITLEGTGASIVLPIKSTGGGTVTIDPDAIAIEATSAIGAVGKPAFLNGWVNFGGSRKVAGYYKDKFGNVRLEGTIKSGAIGSAAFTLPAGYRPSGRVQFAAATLNAAVPTFGHIIVDSDGNVYPNAGGTTEFSLDSVAFKTAP